LPAKLPAKKQYTSGFSDRFREEVRRDQRAVARPPGYIRSASYILAATLNTTDAKGLEEFSFDGLAIMTFALMPVIVAGQTIYVPVRPST